MKTLASLLPKVAVFGVSALLSGVIASVAVLAMQDHTPVATIGMAPQFMLQGLETPAGSNMPAIPGALAAFNEQASGSAAPAATLSPADLAAAADALLGGTPVSFVNPAGFPRVPPVTQFDGGPLQGANCTLAAGAMLARLGYGIVTTGSTLRTLQDKQDGGTSINDLATALWRGYGVTFRSGLIRTQSLKSLLAAGYGAVIQGDYGKIPPALRLQRDFTGGHAIYLDGYYPGNASRGIPEAYYVIDPIGRPAYGYQGDWWPASVVDDFALSWGGGRVVAMWAFPPGGTPPDVVGPDVLPIPASASGSPSASQSPAPSGSVTPSESPAPSGAATPTASPTGPILPPLFNPGEISVILAPAHLPVQGGALGVVSIIPIFDICLTVPKPSGCPTGIEAVFNTGPPIVLKLPSGPTVNVVFVDSDRPDVAIVGFTVDPPATSNVHFWATGGGPSSVLSASSMTSLNLLGQTLILARLDVHAGTTYQFQVIAGSGPSAASSPVGTFTTGDGVSQFDVAVSSVTSPTIKLGTGLSPYLHLALGAYAQPMVKVSSLPGGACAEVASFGGTPFCLDLGPAAPPPARCTQAAVSYALTGIDATGVVVRAFPSMSGTGSGGGLTLDGVLEADGPAGSGTVNVGCLASGMTYQITLDAVGDSRGILATRTITAS